MFNNRGGWVDRGGWRGNSGTPVGSGRWNNRNQYGTSFRGRNDRGMSRARGMGFNEQGRGSYSRGFSIDDNFKFRGRGNRRVTSNNISGNWSAGDRSLRNLTRNNIEEFDNQSLLTTVKHEPVAEPLFQTNDSSFSSTNIPNEEPINQSPDISSSTEPPKKLNHPTARSSSILDANVQRHAPSSNQSSYNLLHNAASAHSKSGVVRCEPCGVGIVGETVSWINPYPGSGVLRLTHLSFPKFKSGIETRSNPISYLKDLIY